MPSTAPTAPKKSLLDQLARYTVRCRLLIMLGFLVAVLYCAFSINKVKINEDLTSYLPPDCDTYKALSIMDSEFKTYASVEYMVSNIPYDRAEQLAGQIAEIDGVVEVAFDDTARHYTDSSALYSITFDGLTTDELTVNAYRQLKALTAGYDCYDYTDIDYDFMASLTGQIVGVVIIVAAVIFIVLTITSRSYCEVFIFFIVFAVAAVLNMGTNFLLGTISSLTNAVTVVLQLALAIDYAIILSHRYQDELDKGLEEREAMSTALSHAIAEITSSSLTTIAGLVGLTLMSFRLGFDVGVVLSKGILCSMLTVFFLMPGLLLALRGPLGRTRHRSFVPSILGWGKFLMHSRSAFVALFLALLIPGVGLYYTTTYVFSDRSVDDLIRNDRRSSMRKIDDTFGTRCTMAILVPEGDFDKEKALLLNVSQLEHVESVASLSTYEVTPGHYLTDLYTPQMISDLVDIPAEQATLLFIAYGVEHNDFQGVFGNASSYKIPLVNIVLYLFEKLDQGIVTLDAHTMETINGLRGTLIRGIEQSRGENWDRLVLTAALPVESEESYALIDEIHALAEHYYGDGRTLVIGDTAAARDLEECYHKDATKIDLLTALMVFIILLLTFRSVVGSLILVGIVQSAVWFNFALLHLSGTSSFFVTNTIVAALQMGATIDYAIVLMSRYQALRRHLPQRQAMANAVNDTFATILTSGSILTVAGFIIAARVTDVYVGHIGLAIGRGSLISIALVMTALPQLIVLLDGLIEKTRFELNIQWIDRSI